MEASSTRRGTLFMLLSMFLLAALDATARTLTQTYPVPQIMWVRFLIFFAVAALIVRRGGLAAAFRSARPKFQIARAVFLLFEMGIFILSLRYLPLADVHAVAAAAPLLVMALAWPVLGERVGPRRWTAVIVGFLGVLVILRPGFRDLDWSHFLPVAAMAFWAVYQIMLRVAGRVDPAQTTLIYTAAGGAIVLTAIGPFFWVPPDAAGWGLLLLAGLLGGGGHFVLIKALEAAPASHLQPYSYSLVVWAVLLGWIVYGEFPDAWTLAGGAVVVLVGLYSLSREGKARE